MLYVRSLLRRVAKSCERIAVHFRNAPMEDRRVYELTRSFSQLVGWTCDRQPATVENVSVDHGRTDVRVSQKLLNRADVSAGLQQMRRKGVTKRVTGRPLGYPASPKAQTLRNRAIPQHNSLRAGTADYKLGR